VSLPGQPNLPGSGWQPPRKCRRKRKRVFCAVTETITRGGLTLSADPGGPDGWSTALAEVDARGKLRVLEVHHGRPGERPSTYEHPLAIAARLGRRNSAVLADLPDPADPAQVRAFTVSRDRSRAYRWGWKSEFWARGGGRDNRSMRRHSR